MSRVRPSQDCLPEPASGWTLLRRAPEHILPAYFEAVRQAPGFKGHIAHVGWPWYDEGVAVLNTTTGVFPEDPADWDLRWDLSFGPPTEGTHTGRMPAVTRGILSIRATPFGPFLLPKTVDMFTASSRRV